jgi:hypothetical protein
MKRLILVVALLTCVAGRSAHAQGEIAGPFKLDFQLGPYIGVSDWNDTQFGVGFIFGIDLTSMRRYHIYFDIPVNFAFSSSGNTDFTFITILPGIEAHFRLQTPTIPIYLYPRFGMGVGIARTSWPGDSVSDSGFGLNFGFGVRFQLAPIFHLFFEPMNLQIFPAGFEGATPVTYYLVFGAGFDL